MHTRWRFVGLIILLGIFFTQVAAASPHNAVTFDEQYHITPGYVYLKTGDLRFHHEQNPPLFESITALPLLLRSDIQLPINDPAYKLWSDVYLFSDDFLWHANADAQGIIQSGRLSIAVIGVLFGLLLFVWGKQLFGELAGWIAAFLFVFDPNFIANAIPTLDLGLAFTVTLATWRLWRYLKHPSKLNLMLTGLALGFALATKFLSVMLLPSFTLILIIYPQPQSASRSTHYSLLAVRFLHFLVMLLLAYLVIWLTYGLQFGAVNGAGLPIPAPQYFESFIGMFLKSSEGRANFLIGQVSVTGWWYYFIVAFLIKTPIPTLLVILFGVIRWPWRIEWRESIVLIAPALLFFGGASISKLQLGYRYILPVLPFLFLIAARFAANVISSAARNLSDNSQRFFASLRMTASMLLATWLSIGTLSIFPHYLSYFNESIGGPANGYKYLIDSNLDWGQDLPALKDWIDQHQPDHLQLGFFGSAYPDRYGINAKSIPSVPLDENGTEVDGFTSYSLEPGQYALSATLLRVGLVFKQFNLYQNFESLTPIDHVANSILIYDVKYPPDAPIDRAVIIGPLASDVLPGDLGYQANQPLRAKWCDPAQCFIFTPHPARYAILDFIPFSAALSAQANSLAKVIPSPMSSYKVFDLDASRLIQNQLASLQKSDTSGPGGLSVTLPISFDNGLSFAGYEVKQLSDGLNVDTYWLVNGAIRPPLTIFVHVLDTHTNIVGQDDSFGAATRMLEPGDLIVQHHSIKINDGTLPGTYRLEIGLYNPNTGNRFMAHPANGTVDHLLLSAIEIK